MKPGFIPICIYERIHVYCRPVTMLSYMSGYIYIADQLQCYQTSMETKSCRHVPNQTLGEGLAK